MRRMGVKSVSFPPGAMPKAAAKASTLAALPFLDSRRYPGSDVQVNCRVYSVDRDREIAAVQCAALLRRQCPSRWQRTLQGSRLHQQARAGLQQCQVCRTCMSQLCPRSCSVYPATRPTRTISYFFRSSWCRRRRVSSSACSFVRSGPILEPWPVLSSDSADSFVWGGCSSLQREPGN